MMAVRTCGAVLDGAEAVEVAVEARISTSLRPQEVRLVGLADQAVREGLQRARAALWPFVAAAEEARAGGVLINLSPADLKKTGRGLDLPLAMALAALHAPRGDEAAQDCLFLGELGLGGLVRPVGGALIVTLLAAQRGRGALAMHPEDLAEARLVEGPDLYAVRTLEEALRVLHGEARREGGPRGLGPDRARTRGADLAEVRGQHLARRALEIAAAGDHNLLLEGPPGAGKTMLARRLTGLMPALDPVAALEVATIRSAVRTLDPQAIYEPPFRAPHHSATPAGLAGGGQPLRPGEITLAHHGVLFLDELPEFDRRALEILREPLEEGELHLSRAGRARCFPARFLCIAAMNPCPCGHAGLSDGRCRCGPAKVSRYRARVSGPLLDRFDLRVFLHPVPPEELVGGEGERTQESIPESTAVVAARVAAARQRRRARLEELRSCRSRAEIADGCERAPQPAAEGPATLAPLERRALRSIIRRQRMSARATARLVRVARTLADLGGSEDVTVEHLAEAALFRLGAELEASQAPTQEASRSPASAISSPHGRSQAKEA